MIRIDSRLILMEKQNNSVMNSLCDDVCFIYYGE